MKSPEYKESISEDFNTPDDLELIKQVRNRYESLPFLENGKIPIPKIKIKFGERLKAHQRITLVQWYIAVYKTTNASRISRLIYRDFGIHVKRQTITKDIKQFKSYDNLTYVMVERTKTLDIMRLKEKHQTSREKLKLEMETIQNYHKNFNTFEKIHHDKVRHGNVKVYGGLFSLPNPI